MKKPKGTLLIMGGAVDKGDSEKLDMAYENREFEELELLKVFVSLIKPKRPHIEIITTASNEPEEAAKPYIKALKELGAPNAFAMHINTREEGHDPEFVERIEKANAVFFTGGDQFRLTTMLGCTDVLNKILHKYRTEDFVVAGSSAGAMAMPYTMIYEGHNPEALLMGDVQTTGGLGFIDGCIIDTHFIKRGRFGRLIHSIIANPGCVGIGLGEDTGLLITEGNLMKCYGSGMVVIIDGKHIGHTNITYVEKYTPVCVENLKVHVLAKGNGYLLKDRQYIVDCDAKTSAPLKKEVHTK